MPLAKLQKRNAGEVTEYWKPRGPSTAADDPERADPPYGTSINLPQVAENGSKPGPAFRLRKFARAGEEGLYTSRGVAPRPSITLATSGEIVAQDHAG
jgi:hypothetical protein